MSISAENEPFKLIIPITNPNHNVESKLRLDRRKPYEKCIAIEHEFSSSPGQQAIDERILMKTTDSSVSVRQLKCL